MEGCGVCSWSKIEPRDTWAASPGPAQEGENSSAAPGHPWGSQVLGQPTAPSTTTSGFGEEGQIPEGVSFSPSSRQAKYDA